MLNIICVKWGTKYDYTFVNNLYKMCCKNFSDPFNFYCYTDDSDHINENVKIIKIPKDNNLEMWWNKLALFKKEMFKGTCLFFDLDVVIQNPINYILLYKKKNELTLIKPYWKEISKENIGFNPKMPENSWDCLCNSSVMLWEANELNHTWEHFYEDTEFYMFKYRGIDRFLYHEGFKLNYFPKNIIYSRLYGIDLKKRGPRIRKVKEKTLEFNLFYEPNYDICIFNGYGKTKDKFKGIHLDKSSYKGFEKYWS